MLKKCIAALAVFITFTSYTFADSKKEEVQSTTSAIQDHNTPRTGSDKDQKSVSTTLKITDAWARASTPSNNNSAVYMVINNPTQNQVTILGASAMTIANRVELHKSFVDDQGISRMVSIDKLVVPAKSSVSLAPGGSHIMLFDLKRTLNISDTFQLTVDVEKMDPITVNVTVK